MYMKRKSVIFKWHLLKKKALSSSVYVFCWKVLIEETIFTSPSGDGTAILPGHPSPQRITYVSKVISWPWVLVQLRESSAVKRSKSALTSWANPAKVERTELKLRVFQACFTLAMVASLRRKKNHSLYTMSEPLLDALF